MNKRREFFKFEKGNNDSVSGSDQTKEILYREVLPGDIDWDKWNQDEEDEKSEKIKNLEKMLVLAEEALNNILGIDYEQSPDIPSRIDKYLEKALAEIAKLKGE